MEPTLASLGCRMAEILSEMLGGAELIAYTVHWLEGDRPEHSPWLENHSIEIGHAQRTWEVDSTPPISHQAR